MDGYDGYSKDRKTAAMAALIGVAALAALGIVCWASFRTEERKDVPVYTHEEVEVTERPMTQEEIAERDYWDGQEAGNSAAPGDEAAPEDLPCRVLYNNDWEVERFEEIPIELIFRFKYWLEAYISKYADSTWYNVTFLNETYDGSDPSHPTFRVTVDEIPDVEIICTYSAPYEEFHFAQTK